MDESDRSIWTEQIKKILDVDGVFQSKAVNGTTLDVVVLFFNSQTDATYRGRKPGRSGQKITAVFNSWSDRPNRAMLGRGARGPIM